MAKRKIKEPVLDPEPPMEDAGSPGPYYIKTTWKGMKEVFKCERCGTFRDDKDSIIMHVLTHYPKQEQEALLDQLLKET